MSLASAWGAAGGDVPGHLARGLRGPGETAAAGEPAVRIKVRSRFPEKAEAWRRGACTL